ncbi:coproporphyrinogen III oxidase [Bacillus sp. M6-12]|uniref:radical SAM family heme chaperone HemW n=1 Tax=Bacillus sp. M6-12 TaxID=2054166 RepID=UPI000C793FFC|nr:radical SAM family heme chaperone HemW [Bacillus sp. M6-12]PLS15176.1 coproporphyrinogen III oxidase [Bacillus sp. M6-12]
MIKSAYIHIPFCEHICHYCDFNKVYLHGQPVEEYLSMLKKEFQLSLREYPVDSLKTIFVGGGTPTSLDEKQLSFFVDSIQNELPYDRNAVEFTFEANPGDLSEEKLAILHQAGVNRLSFGVQSFNEELLKKIGRTHRVEDIYASIEKAKKVGFQNISIDLIYGLPGQTMEDFEDTLAKALELELEHYSSYSLIVEPKTVFYNLMQKGRLSLPPQEIEARMYERVMDEMVKHGYIQYEISNYAKPGYESKHNLTYWNNEEYFGFGAGAHGYTGGKRKANYGPLKKYISPLQEGRLPLIETHEVSKQEKMEEEMFLGLRKMEGVSSTSFKEKFGSPLSDIFGQQLIELQKRGLLEERSGTYLLTRNGKLLGNEVFQSFIAV